MSVSSLPLPPSLDHLSGLGSGVNKFHADSRNKQIGSDFPSPPSLPPVKYQEMSPEVTLVEFISTSAAFHGIKRQNIKDLEWDILKVFTNNVMPANAAAWYMAKRRFYMANTYEHQLLPFLLKNYPKKFAVKGNVVEFLEVYNKEVARKKMVQMIKQGILAYFQHKVEEYGVYFFDPYYYETTEPFHANLQVAAKGYNVHRSKLLPAFFSQHENQFTFQSHSPYLVTISKQPVEVKINTVGIVVSMVDNQFGIIQFPSGTGTEKALFCAKSLFRDGWLYQGDPMKLPPMEFDGYRVPGAPVSHGKGEKGQSVEYTWYAVLVWCGRKPSPKYCATKEDLASSPYFQSVQNTPGLPLGNMLSTGVSFEELTRATKGHGGRGYKKGHNHQQQADSKIPCMQVGEVLSIKNYGAVVSLGKDSDEKAFIPGWAHHNNKFKGDFMTTTQGVELAIGDLITFCVDPAKTEPRSYKCVGCNVTVLKHADYKGKGLNVVNSASLLPAGDASSAHNLQSKSDGEGEKGKKGKKASAKKGAKDKGSPSSAKSKARNNRKKSEGGDSSSNEKADDAGSGGKRKSRAQRKGNRKSTTSVSSSNGNGAQNAAVKDLKERTDAKGTKRTKRKSEGSGVSRRPQRYLYYLLAPPKSREGKMTEDGQEKDVDEAAAALSDSASEYDSDVDPGYLPPPSHDPDLDYDEYSDGEVPEEEQKDLQKEAKEEFTQEMRLELKQKLDEFEAAEKETATTTDKKGKDIQDDKGAAEKAATAPEEVATVQQGGDATEKNPAGEEAKEGTAAVGGQEGKQEKQASGDAVTVQS